MKKILILCLLVCCACAPSQQAVQTAVIQTQAAWTAVPTQTAYPTYTIVPTYTPHVVIVLVTPTLTSTPPETATVTSTPLSAAQLGRTATAEAMIPLETTRSDGYYLINIDIAPGNWRSDAGYSTCYWEIDDANGNAVSNDFGMSGGVIHVPANEYQLKLERCGNITFLK